MVGQGALSNVAFAANLMSIVTNVLAVLFMIAVLVCIYWVLSRFGFLSDLEQREAEQRVESSQPLDRVDSGVALSGPGNG